MTPKKLPILLGVAVVASTAFYLYVVAGSGPTVASIPTISSAPEIGQTRTDAFTEEPAPRSSVAESRTTPAGSVPASDHGTTNERPTTPIPAKASAAIPTLQSQPQTAHTHTNASPEEPAWRSAVAGPRTAPAGSAPVSDNGPASDLPTAQNPTAASAPAARAPEKLPVPIVLQDFDHQAAGLTPAQVQALNSLRQDFVSEVGGPGQDPSDPGYAARWREAQPRYDDELRSMFGTSFVEQLGLLAAQVRYEATQKK